MEFSKKFAVGVLIGYGLLVLLCILLISFKSADLMGLVVTITSIPTVVVTYYYNKSKSENLLKIQNSNTCQNTNQVTNSNNTIDNTNKI